MSVKALLFDVFGTCVDWRGTVVEALQQAGQAAGPETSAGKLTSADWADFAQEWRESYLRFTRMVASDPGSAWKTIDEHHHDSLVELLTARGLVESFTDDQIMNLSLIWHRLEPWPDTNRGLAMLNDQGLDTCTLSNGNMALLQDMCRHAQMPFARIFSAELFHSYKPNPRVYLGAAQELGLSTGQCAMVAAHLEDLRAAKALGFKTAYVERPGEERSPELKGDGFVDLWVAMNERGFETLAQRVGTLSVDF